MTGMMTKSSAVVAMANLGFASTLGGSMMFFLNENFRGLSAIAVLLGLVLQLYFGHKNQKRQDAKLEESKRHNRKIEDGINGKI